MATLPEASGSTAVLAPNISINVARGAGAMPMVTFRVAGLRLSVLDPDKATQSWVDG